MKRFNPIVESNEKDSNPEDSDIGPRTPEEVEKWAMHDLMNALPSQAEKRVKTARMTTEQRIMYGALIFSQGSDTARDKVCVTREIIWKRRRTSRVCPHAFTR